MSISVKEYFDPATFSFTYLVTDTDSKEAAIIDPVMGFDVLTWRTNTEKAEAILAEIKQQELTLKWIFETHAHADHLSAADWLRDKTGAPIVIGQGITQVQKTFNQLYELEGEQAASHKDFDFLAEDEQTFMLGKQPIQVLHTPGHTPSCCTYVVAGLAFVGDTLFMPDYGTARCDFPDGDAGLLYRSIQRILSLPEETQLMMCHDYMPGGRELRWQSTVKEQKASNVHINDKVTEAEYIAMRNERDSLLTPPKLILASLQVNIRAGRLPEASQEGTHFLKLPLNKI